MNDSRKDTKILKKVRITWEDIKEELKKKPFSNWDNPLSIKLRGDPNIDQNEARKLMNKRIIVDDVEEERTQLIIGDDFEDDCIVEPNKEVLKWVNKNIKKPLFTNLTPVPKGYNFIPFIGQPLYYKVDNALRVNEIRVISKTDDYIVTLTNKGIESG